MKMIYALLFLFVSFHSYSLDELEEIELELFDTQKRECFKSGQRLSINGDQIEVYDDGVKKEFTKFEESDDFIFGDFINIKNLNMAKKNTIPGILILKKGKKTEWVIGPSQKFRKTGSKENCQITNINNLHCYSNINGKYNLNVHKKRIKYTEKASPKSRLVEHSYTINKKANLPSYAISGNKKNGNGVIYLVNLDGILYKITAEKIITANCDLTLTDI